MTVVYKLYASIAKNTSTTVVFVRGKQVRYDASTINQLLHLQYTPYKPDELDMLLE